MLRKDNKNKIKGNIFHKIQNMRAIIIEDYSAQWPVAFEQLKAVYNSRLQPFIEDIEHVGSTAVPGLAAKPVLDIDIIIKDKTHFSRITAILEAWGYAYEGERGIPGREAFAKQTATTPDDGSGTNWLAHHLYVCLQDSDSLKNHLSLRDFLRANPGVATQYGQLKKQLAEKYRYDIDGYVENKTAFITAILEKTGFDQVTLNNITQQNEKISP
jgi:GrpB-like predicted nucleotidyltransferase (UPF0157 family)